MKTIQFGFFKDVPVGKIEVAGRKRVLYQRLTDEGVFVRFVCRYLKREIAAKRKSYGIAGKHIGISEWFEVTSDEVASKRGARC